MERGSDARARARARCWARYHPVVADNVRRLREISGLDEVSFHMSGTEAVMQAVRLARYHTRPHRTWCASAAPTTAGGATCSRASATRRRRARPTRSRTWTRTRCACCATRKRHRLRAGEPAAGDAPERQRAQRRARWSTAAAAPASTATAYTRLAAQQLREVCTERGIVLIFDEVFVGFRLAPRRRAGVLRRRGRHGHLRQDAGRRAARSAWCAGARDLMKRFRDDAPGRHLLRARHVQLATPTSWRR